MTITETLTGREPRPRPVAAPRAGQGRRRARVNVAERRLTSPLVASLRMSSGLSPINRVLNLIPKRAEQRQADQLRDTFVDAGVASALQAIDHQVLDGRRGTGNTHALRYLESEVWARGDVAVYPSQQNRGHFPQASLTTR
jgi:hypothetical protein